MVFPNPVFNDLPILFSLLNNKVCFSFGRYVGHVVIDLIPLPSAVLEVRGEWDRRWSERNFQRLKRRLMVPQANNAVALAGYHNLGDPLSTSLRSRPSLVRCSLWQCSGWRTSFSPQ
jgi:hypothetical protein